MRDRRRLLLVLPAIWLVALLALPALLWLGGDRQPLLESRAKEAFPPLNRHTFADPAAIRRLDTALLDRLPGRDRALDLHARIANDLFHDSSNPDVAIGKDGYLYYVPELAQCRAGATLPADPADMLDVLSRTLVAAGVRTTVTVAPSKLIVHADDAPEIDAAAERCERELEERVDARLAETPGGLALGPELKAHEAAGRSTVLRKDTHWNWRGRELFARRVLDRVRPGLAEQIGLRAGPERDRPGDLLAMLGRDGGERDRELVVASAPAPPLAPGSVAMVGDSQMDRVFFEPPAEGELPLAAAALPDQPYCPWESLMTGACDAQLRAARTVVVEKVARDMAFVAAQCWRPIALLGERLRDGRPARLEPVGGDGAVSARGTLTIPAGGSVRVRLGAGADVSATPRLLRLPLARRGGGAAAPVTVAQEPTAGGPVPCATPSQIGPGGLFLPVPAGRALSELVLRLSGEPGTVIERPQAFALDGRRLD